MVQSSLGREREVVDAFVGLAATLVERFDPLEFMHVVARRCVELLDCSEAGILVSPEGHPASLQVLGSSSERAEALEVLQWLNQRGPCVECWSRQDVVVTDDLERDRDRWPLFAPPALERGVRAVHSMPMRSRGEVLGVLNLFRDRPGRLSEGDGRLAQGLADLAAVGLLHERTTREADAVVVQLQGALHSRVVIEQAKGIVAASHGVSVEDAFGLIRGYARSHNRLLSDVARQIVEEELDPQLGGGIRDASRRWGSHAAR